MRSFSLFLFIYSVSADPYSFSWSAGQLSFSCDRLGSGWIQAGESCFYAYAANRFNWSEAQSLCRTPDLHYSTAAFTDNWLVARSLRNNKIQQLLYWTGLLLTNETISISPLLTKETIYNPLWAADQPPIKLHKLSCLALDLSSDASLGWRLFDCDHDLPVLCQTFACLPNTFRCSDNSRCIPNKAVNDGIIDCVDGSDETKSAKARMVALDDCRHAKLTSEEGEFSTPSFPSKVDGGVECRWEIEVPEGKVVAYSVEGLDSNPDRHFTVSGNNDTLMMVKPDLRSTVSNSQYLEFRLRPGSMATPGFRVVFRAADPEPCQISSGLAIYDSQRFAFDCTFRASAPFPSQYLLFLVEHLEKSTSASINVSSSSLSFGFTGPGYSQAVVIPASEAALTVQNAWLSPARTQFRIRVIPFGSACIVVPVTFPAMSFHWPKSTDSVSVPHCISFAVVARNSHLWRVDEAHIGIGDSVRLKPKIGSETVVSSECSYEAEGVMTISILQLSPEFTISFRFSQDCAWPTGSFRWGTSTACSETSEVKESKCLIGGRWTIEPSVCLFDASDDTVCPLPIIHNGWPLSANFSINSLLSFACQPGFVSATYDSFCTSQGSWSPSPGCYVGKCSPPDNVYRSGILITNFTSPIYGTVIEYAPPPGMKPAKAIRTCMTTELPGNPIDWVDFGFQFVAEGCYSYSIDYGQFTSDFYPNGNYADIDCVPGFTPPNNMNSSKCVNGQWEAIIQGCQPKYIQSTACGVNGTAIDTKNGGYICDCQKGFSSQDMGYYGQKCLELQECAMNIDLCDCYASCQKTDPGYSCICPQGYEIYNASSNLSSLSNSYIPGKSCKSKCLIADLPLKENNWALRSYEDIYKVGWNISIYCNTKMAGVGNNNAFVEFIATCFEDGWHFEADPCRTTCDSLPHDNVLLTGTPLPVYLFDTVKIECQDPFMTLLGSDKVMCLWNGEFSGTGRSSNNVFPTCIYQHCSDLSPFAKQEGFNYSSSIEEDPFRIGAQVFIKGCDPPYVNCVFNSDGIAEWNTNEIKCGPGPPGGGRTTTFVSFGTPPTLRPTITHDPTTTFRPTGWTTRNPHRHFKNIVEPEATPLAGGCTLNKCSNGICITGDHGPSCSCNYGFVSHGNSCVLNSAPYSFCSNEGTKHVDTDGGCECNPGFGTNRTDASWACVDNFSQCPTGNCPLVVLRRSQAAYSTCMNILNDGSYLIDCGNIPQDTCPCAHGGYCIGSLPSTLPCNCPPGWGGETCETSLSCLKDDDTPVCENGGTCYPPTGACYCPPPFTGRTCSNMIDYCQSGYCKYGQCQPYYTGYFCKCDQGYTGDHCNETIDFCSIGNPCVSGSCHSNTTSTFCVCDGGYTGDLCDEPTTAPCPNGICGSFGTCKALLPADHICICDPGHMPLGISDCDGDISYCDLQPCLNGGNCSNISPEGYACGCPAGFTGPVCETEIDPCNGVNCGPNGHCEPTSSGVRCRCDPGFTGDVCEKQIPCTLSCIHGECQFLFNGTQWCNCTSPYSGPLCDYTSIPCTATTCLGYGTCITTPDGNYCKCYDGYKGEHCEQAKTCADFSYSCENGGTCVLDTNQKPVCECPPATSGDRCEVLGTTCSDITCQNGATCVEDNQMNAHCLCPLGFYGNLCERNSTSSFNLFFNGLPSSQKFVSRMLNTSLYKEFTLCGWVQYAPSKVVKLSDTLPPFMAIVAQGQQVVSVDNQGAILNSNRFMKVTISSLAWHHICLRSPEYYMDKTVWAYFLDGALVANATNVVLPQNNHTLYYIELAPKSDFEGEISLVQLYSSRLTDSDVASLAFSCSKFTHSDLLISWTQFTTLERGNAGVLQLQPGICDASDCLPGRPSCNTTDKIPPVVVSCPDDMGKVSASRLTIVTWDTPVFQDNVAITTVSSNFRSGQAFSWGYYRVVYIGSDAAGNTATCAFSLVIAPSSCVASSSVNGGQVTTKNVNGTNSLMTAEVSCDDTQYPRSNPLFYVCDVFGQWDRSSYFTSGLRYAFPSCGATTDPTQEILGTLSANGTCEEIYDGLYKTLDYTLEPVCGPNCTEFSIIPQCPHSTSPTKTKRRINFDEFTQTFNYIININSTREMLAYTVENSVRLTFPDGNSTVNATYDCEDDYPQHSIDGNLYSCGDCAPGTYWDGTKCVDCPPDTYRTEKPQSRCLPCPDNTTTGGITKATAAKMCYRICDFGSYYDIGKDDCVKCPQGSFQIEKGRTECISCPLYTSTYIEGATNKEDCSWLCTPGSEFDDTGTRCNQCGIGTFKNVSLGSCLPCPLGFSTTTTGSRSVLDCDNAFCPPNYIVSKSIPYPLNISTPFEGVCTPCEMGNYQPKYNQTSCIPCPSQDTAPTCVLVTKCSPLVASSCSSMQTCSAVNGVVGIFSCAAVQVQPVDNGHKAVVWIAVGVSVSVVVIAAAIVAWLCRDRLFCCKTLKRMDVTESTDFYRAPRRHRASSFASSKSEQSVIPEDILPERPVLRPLPPPIITSRAALAELEHESPPSTPPSSPRPVQEEEDDDDDYFG